ncbi:MAG: lipopolysaccharide assembly protein LapA domain-containing protein, partial [Verrucomicrobiota bacterium]
GNTSILVVIVAAFAVGVVGAGLASIPAQLRRRSDASAARQRIRELEGEVRTLQAEVETLKRKAEGGKPGGAA